MGELGTCDHCGNYANWCDDCLEKGRNRPSALSDGVMPARVEERMEAYHILFPDGGMYFQRKEVIQATDNPLSFKEIVIVKLCETILGKQA